MITDLAKSQLDNEEDDLVLPLVIETTGVLNRTCIQELVSSGLSNPQKLDGEPFVFGQASIDSLTDLDSLRFTGIIDADREVELHIELPGYFPNPIGIVQEELESTDIVSINDTAEYINARQATEEFGSTGEGVRVGIIDTGFDHPMIEPAKVAEKDFTDTNLRDEVGHGSWVAGHILGRPTEYDGNVDKFKGEVLEGIAPKAEFVGAKVINEVGVDAITTPQSRIMEAMNWVVKEQNADVVNMSLGVLPACGSTGVSRLINRLTEDEGAFFTVSAGNAYTYGTIGAPGQSHLAITVSSVATRNPRPNRISTFSSKGPACARTGINVAAPGGNTTPNEFIIGPSPSYAELSGSNGWSAIAGTSMAAPNTCGVITQLLSSVGIEDRQQIERALSGSSDKVGPITRLKGLRYGWGVLNSIEMHRFIDDPIVERAGTLRANNSLRVRAFSPVSNFISNSSTKPKDVSSPTGVLEDINDYYDRQSKGDAIAWDKVSG